jgi:hypothetical protein
MPSAQITPICVFHVDDGEDLASTHSGGYRVSHDPDQPAQPVRA